MRLYRWISIVFIIFAGMAQAQAYVELNGFYTSDALTVTGGSAASGRTYFEGAIGFEIDKKGRYLVGWGYASFSTTDTSGGTTTTYSSSQMGPRFLWIIDKKKNWSLGLAYYLVTTGSYAPSGGTSEQWKGTALKADFGYNFPVTEKFHLGLRMNYSSATYTEKFVGEAYTKVSNTKSAIYPSVYSIWYW